MNGLMTWLQGTWLNRFMVETSSAFVTAETLHFIGLTMLLGGLIIIDLRGLGLLKRMPLIALHRLLPLVAFGFCINLLTGIAFLAYDPGNYLGNAAFLTKMALIVIAGINALVFEFAIFRPLVAGNTAVENGALIKISSGLSLILWFAVLLLGRLIPYA